MQLFDEIRNNKVTYAKVAQNKINYESSLENRCCAKFSADSCSDTITLLDAYSRALEKIILRINELNSKSCIV